MEREVEGLYLARTCPVIVMGHRWASAFAIGALKLDVKTRLYHAVEVSHDPHHYCYHSQKHVLCSEQTNSNSLGCGIGA